MKPINMDRLRARLDRFVSKAPEGCWEFGGSKTKFGHGRMTAGRGVNLKAHRAAYMAWVGPIPNGLCVLHKCDNPPCCNPAHLFLGTPADNIHDMDAKGRRVARGKAKSPRRSNENMRRGEANTNSVLTEGAVRKIRGMSGGYGKIAAALGVSKSTVCSVIKRQTWRHVA